MISMKSHDPRVQKAKRIKTCQSLWCCASLNKANGYITIEFKFQRYYFFCLSIKQGCGNVTYEAHLNPCILNFLYYNRSCTSTWWVNTISSLFQRVIKKNQMQHNIIYFSY